MTQTVIELEGGTPQAILLHSIDNVRALGGIAVAGGRMVKHGILFRGSALAGLSAGNAYMLFN